jgi:hypothetical protein
LGILGVETSMLKPISMAAVLLFAFAAKMALQGSPQTASMGTVEGTVTALGTGNPISGV